MAEKSIPGEMRVVLARLRGEDLRRFDDYRRSEPEIPPNGHALVALVRKGLEAVAKAKAKAA